MTSSKRTSRRARSCAGWLATTDAQGQPNVSPKEIWCLAGDDRVLIGNIASPNSLRNLRASALVCVSFIDVFRQIGLKCYGSGQVIGAGDALFAELATPLVRLAGDDYPIRDVIDIQVTRSAAIIAPSYKLFPERSEADRIRDAQTRYGVRPAD